MTVVYRADDPTKAHIRGVRQAIPALMLAGGGVILVAGGLLVLWFMFDTAGKQSPPL